MLKKSASNATDDSDVVTYEIPGEGKLTLKCCLCHQPTGKSGWCPSCERWPINLTPIRWCENGHRVDVDGWCARCDDYVLSRLEAGSGEWRDTGEVSRRIPKAEVKELIRTLGQRLSVPRDPKRDRQTVRDPESAIGQHAARFRARGLPEDVAWSQAEALCQDPEHVQQCDVCLLLGQSSVA